MLRRFLLLLTAGITATAVNWAWVGNQIAALPDGLQFMVANILLLGVFAWRNRALPSKNTVSENKHPDAYTREILSRELPPFGEFHPAECPGGIVDIVRILPGKELPHNMRLISDAEHKRRIREARLCRELQIPDIVEDDDTTSDKRVYMEVDGKNATTVPNT